MGKRDNIRELINLLTKSLSHKIGSIVNDTKIYAEKYRKESENFLEQAKEISKEENWNNYDKIKIKEELKKKLGTELERKEFLDSKKFDIMNEEIEKALKSLDLS